MPSGFQPILISAKSSRSENSEKQGTLNSSGRSTPFCDHCPSHRCRGTSMRKSKAGSMNGFGISRRPPGATLIVIPSVESVTGLTLSTRGALGKPAPTLGLPPAAYAAAVNFGRVFDRSDLMTLTHHWMISRSTPRVPTTCIDQFVHYQSAMFLCGTDHSRSAERLGNYRLRLKVPTSRRLSYFALNSSEVTVASIRYVPRRGSFWIDSNCSACVSPSAAMTDNLVG